MQQRMARVAARVGAAVARRAATLDSEAASALAAVMSALTTDYGSLPAFTDAEVGPQQDRLADLRAVFDLDPLATDLLTVATAADLDANIGQAYDLLTGRRGNGAITVGLALELCGAPTATAAGSAALQPSAPLRACRLVHVPDDGAWLARPVRAADRVRAHCAGDDTPDARVAALAVETVPFDRAEAAAVAAAIRLGEPLVWVRAPLGTAGLSVATAGLAAAGMAALAVDLRRRGPDVAVADLLACSAREAGLTGRALIVTGVPLVEPGHEAETAACFGVLARSPLPVVVVDPRPWDTAWLTHVPVSVEAPLLSAADREAIWTAALGGPLPAEPGHPPLRNLRLTPEEIVTTARYAALAARVDGTDLDLRAVRDAARLLGSGAGHRASAGGVAAHAGRVPATFDDLALPGHILDDLRRLVRWAAYRDEVLARGPVHGKGGKGTGITALFTGSPGTGKTLSAHVIADELNIEMFQVDLSAVVDKYIGETEKNLEKVFREAESRNVLLFFDEADALFGSRSAVQDARDRYANQEVSYLLQRMEHFDGITVLATNQRGNLDQAFSRRMQFIVHFPDPDPGTRAVMWRQHLERAGGTDTADPVDIAQLAEVVDLSGGDIRNIVLGAAYDAACDGRLIGMADVRAAVVREYRKLGRRVPAPLDAG